MRMLIYYREPVFTIGQAPFVAGAIHVRNQIRAMKRRQRIEKRKALVARVRALARALPGQLSLRRTLPATSSPATANA